MFDYGKRPWEKATASGGSWGQGCCGGAEGRPRESLREALFSWAHPVPAEGQAAAGLHAHSRSVRSDTTEPMDSGSEEVDSEWRFSTEFYVR